jgi:hypothetical protein
MLVVSKVEIRPCVNQLNVQILDEIVGFVAPPLGNLGSPLDEPSMVREEELLMGLGFRECGPQDHADQFLLVLRSTPR